MHRVEVLEIGGAVGHAAPAKNQPLRLMQSYSSQGDHGQFLGKHRFDTQFVRYHEGVELKIPARC